jgi:hypothetical protein
MIRQATACCDSCATHAAKLGTVTCDQDGNCYDDSTGTYTPAAVTSSGSISTGLMWAGGAILAAFVIAEFTGSPAPAKRRRR